MSKHYALVIDFGESLDGMWIAKAKIEEAPGLGYFITAHEFDISPSGEMGAITIGLLQNGQGISTDIPPFKPSNPPKPPITQWKRIDG
jgi:hypothetical protein